MSDRTTRPRLARGLAAMVVAAAMAAVGVTAAAPATADAGTGWIRIAHLSPDTKAVDVQLTALDGGSVAYELDDVAYGAVSPYASVPVGIYTLSMAPAGQGMAGSTIVRSSVRVASDRTITLAAYGPRKKLKLKAFDDDLAEPASGQARIRLIQASTSAKSVDVSTSTGIPIAQDAKPGTVTGYADVPGGPWTLDLKVAASRRDGQQTALSLAGGSVTTLFVLDNASGGLTVKPVLDSAAAPQAPVGGVNTGMGGLAHTFVHSSPR